MGGFLFVFFSFYLFFSFFIAPMCFLYFFHVLLSYFFPVDKGFRMWSQTLMISTKTSQSLQSIRSSCNTIPVRRDRLFDHRCRYYRLRINAWSRIPSIEARSCCGQSEKLFLVIKRRYFKLLDLNLICPKGMIYWDVLVCEPAPSWRQQPGGQRKNLWWKFKEDL